MKSSKIENYDEFIKQIAPSPMPGMDPTKMFSKESLAQMMKQGALQALPGKSGRTRRLLAFYQRSRPAAARQSGRSRGTYTFKGMAQHGGIACAEILNDATIALDFSGGGADPSAQGQAIAQLGMKVSGGTLKGTVWFDPQLGMARDAQLQQEMTITMKNPADPEKTLSVPMKQSITTTLTKVEDIK